MFKISTLNMLGQDKFSFITTELESPLEWNKLIFDTFFQLKLSQEKTVLAHVWNDIKWVIVIDKESELTWRLHYKQEFS